MFKQSDIVFCISNRTKTTGYNIEIGNKYEILNMWGDMLEVKNISGDIGRIHKCVHKSLFVYVDEYRDIKINKLLE